MVWTKRDTVVCILLACIAGFLFIPLLGSVHLFDGEELKSAEIAREMVLTGDYFRTHLDFQTSWEKPPFFYWLQALSMKIFGVNEFAARLPNAVLGMMMLPLLYTLGKHLTGRGNFGILWSLSYGCSMLPLLSFQLGFPDSWFNFWIFLSVCAICGYYAPQNGKVHSMRRIVLAGFAIGMALLTNGAFAVVLVVVLWLLFWFLRRRDELFPLTELAVYCALALAVSFAWYGHELLKSGLWFFREFVRYRIQNFATTSVDSGLLYRPLLLVLGCFPASAFVLTGLMKALRQSWSLLKVRDALATFTVWMLLFFIVAVLTVFFVQTNVVHFASLAYFPITFFAARALDGLLRSNYVFSRLATVILLGLGFLWGAVLVFVPLLGMNKTWVVERIHDAFLRSNLHANMPWSAWTLLPAVGFVLALLITIYFLRKRRYFEMALTLLPATLAVTLCFSFIVAHKLEYYTQSAAVEFYQGLQGQSCYIQTLGFSTYADLFYAQKQLSQSASAANIPAEEFERWLLEDEIDRTAYFVCKTNDAQTWRKHLYLIELYEKNGYVFFQREVKKKVNLARWHQ